MIQKTHIDEASLEKCLQLFMEFGVKSITMQDISKTLNLSKKALYELFSNKQELVDEVISYDFDYVTTNLNEIAVTSSNAIDELLQVSEFIVKRFGQCNPCLMFDLQKYYASSWAIFMQRKMAFINTHILANLTRGDKEGLYRTDFNKEIIARIYFTKMDMFFDETLFPQHEFNFAMLHSEYIIYHLRGIASKKGHDILDISLSLKNMNT